MLSRLPAGLGVLFIAVIACTPPADAPAATAADTAAVDALRQQEMTAVSTGDTMLAFMADDIVLMPPNEPMLTGIAAVRAWFRAASEQVRLSGAYTSWNVVFAGDWAFERNAGTLTITPLAGGAPVHDVFKGIHIYHRDATGTWKLVQDIWNSDQPPVP